MAQVAVPAVQAEVRAASMAMVAEPATQAMVVLVPLAAPESMPTAVLAEKAEMAQQPVPLAQLVLVSELPELQEQVAPAAPVVLVAQVALQP
jgi:hypothetical protein